MNMYRSRTGPNANWIANAARTSISQGGHIFFAWSCPLGLGWTSQISTSSKHKAVYNSWSYWKVVCQIWGFDWWKISLARYFWSKFNLDYSLLTLVAKHYCSVTLAQHTHRIEPFKLLNLHLILNAFCLFENVVAMEFANMMVQVLWFLCSTFFKDNKLLKLQIYALLSHKTPLRLQSNFISFCFFDQTNQG